MDRPVCRHPLPIASASAVSLAGLGISSMSANLSQADRSGNTATRTKQILLRIFGPKENPSPFTASTSQNLNPDRAQSLSFLAWSVRQALHGAEGFPQQQASLLREVARRRRDGGSKPLSFLARQKILYLQHNYIFDFIDKTTA